MLFTVIPSKGRSGSLTTLRHFKQYKLLDHVALAVPKNEVDRYERRAGCQVVGVPEKYSGIARTREWILTKLAPAWDLKHVLMLDDDMDFCYRPNCGNLKLETITTSKEFLKMLNLLEQWLEDGFKHVGLSARQGNNQLQSNRGKLVTEEHSFRDATRMMNAYAYNVPFINKMVRKGKIELGRTPVMEDFDLTLQLLERGYPNRVSIKYCWNQRGSGKSGGCSDYRTGEMQEKAAKKLAKLHPESVKVTIKKAKADSVAWRGMKERYDVNIQWRKAYKGVIE